MRRVLQSLLCFFVLTAGLLGQEKRLWVMRGGDLIEYDLSAFTVKQTVKLPPEALKSPQNISVNHAGQILFSPSLSLPLSDTDAASAHKVWFWNGHAASSIDQGVEHKKEETGSNQAIIESAPMAFLSADGNHLYWFTSQERRLERDNVDLSVSTNWQGWQSDLSGGDRQDVASSKLPDCRCATGTCEETCPGVGVWAPAGGIDRFFLVDRAVSGQTEITYQSSSLYQNSGGKWTATELPHPLERVLDAASDGSIIVEAIPDAGCCGWSNQSDDQTLVHNSGKTVAVFDERATYKNPDYDVSFYTAEARLSPDRTEVAMTVTATAGPNQAIQESEDGQANPEESKQIHKALLDLPAVLVKTVDDPPRQIALVPHASVVGWMNDKELLIVEDRLLVVYNVASGARHKSTVRVEKDARVFLR